MPDRELAARFEETVTERYTEATDTDSPWQILSYVLADARHYADVHGIAFAEADHQAYANYCHEVIEAPV